MDALNVWRKPIVLLSDADVIQRYESIVDKQINIQCDREDTDIVYRTSFCSVPYLADRQEIQLDGCIESMQIDMHFGEFELYRLDRLLGTSKFGRLRLCLAHLETEPAKIWYSTLEQTSKVFAFYKRLNSELDPGMDLTGPIRPIHIKFLNAPEDSSGRVRIEHVPIRCRSIAAWNRKTCTYVECSAM